MNEDPAHLKFLSHFSLDLRTSQNALTVVNSLCPPYQRWSYLAAKPHCLQTQEFQLLLSNYDWVVRAMCWRKIKGGKCCLKWKTLQGNLLLFFLSLLVVLEIVISSGWEGWYLGTLLFHGSPALPVQEAVPSSTSQCAGMITNYT